MLLLIKRLVKSILHMIWETQITIASLLKMFWRCRYVKIPLTCQNEQELLVLVNGPSLDEQLENNLEWFKRRTVLCVNHMAGSKYYCKIRPSYYVMIHSGFFDEKYKTDKERKTLENIVNLTTWNMYLVVPMYARKACTFSEIVERNQNIKICYINLFDFRGFSWLRDYFREKQLVTFACYNVLSASLCAAIYFGFKQIYILGADHNYHQTLRVTDDNYVVRPDPHFYDTKADNNTVIVLRHPDGKKMTMSEQLQSIAEAFGEYEEIEKYAKMKNVSIYNLTPNSSIDAFEKKSYMMCQ